MKSTMKLAMSVAFGIFLVGAIPSVASAQEDISQKQISSLELEQADVREALRALFKNVNVSYSIAPEVQGPITVSLKNVTFETALQNVLRQVDATYRIEAGVYEIVKKADNISANQKDQEKETPKTDTKIIRRIKIRSADPAFIAMMIGQKEGNQNYNIPPERSTLINTGQGGGGGGQGGFGGGGGGGHGGFGGGGRGGGGCGGGSGGVGGGGFGGGSGGGGGMGGGGGRGGFGG